jgi:hypothetical protein
MTGKINIEDIKSSKETHEVPVKMMSGVCQFNAHMNISKNPLINIPL